MYKYSYCRATSYEGVQLVHVLVQVSNFATNLPRAGTNPTLHFSPVINAHLFTMYHDAAPMKHRSRPRSQLLRIWLARASGPGSSGWTSTTVARRPLHRGVYCCRSFKPPGRRWQRDRAGLRQEAARCNEKRRCRSRRWCASESASGSCRHSSWWYWWCGACTPARMAQVRRRTLGDGVRKLNLRCFPRRPEALWRDMSTKSSAYCCGVPFLLHYVVGDRQHVRHKSCRA